MQQASKSKPHAAEGKLTAVVVAAAGVLGGLYFAWVRWWQLPRQLGLPISLRVGDREAVKLDLQQARALVGTSTHDKGEVWLDELLVEWDAATDDASRLAAVNEAVSEAGYRIDCSIAGVRHAIGLVLACTLIAVSASVAGGDYGPLWMVFPMGLFGMGGCILAGRAARKRVQRARRAVDAIVDLLTVDLNDAAIVLPPARSRRPRRHGRRF